LATVFSSVEASHLSSSAGAASQVLDIVLIEDNPQDVELTRSAFELSRLANHLTVLRDGKEALEFLFRLGKYADQPLSTQNTVVLLDLSLPKVDGLEILRRMRADDRTRTVPVFILTASRRDEHIRQAMQLGANSYIVKPVDFNGLNEVGSKLSLRWALLQAETT
jgi:two-component system, response regulator